MAAARITTVGLWLLLRLSLAAGEEASVQGGQIRGRVSIPAKFQQQLGNERGGLSQTKVVVNGGEKLTLPTADGYFNINDVVPGTYLLQVVHPVLRFDPVLVEATSKNGVSKMSAYLADLEHGKGAKLKYPLGLAPSEVYQYLEKREQFDISTIFKNPMAMMGLFSCGVMFLLPKLQPMLEEEKARQKGSQAEVDEK